MKIPKCVPLVSFPSVAEIATSDYSAPIQLDDRSVHIRGYSLESNATALGRFREWLSDDELARAGRFIRQEDQVRYVLAHGVLRFVLARYCEYEPATLRFQVGSTGKPVLLDQQGRAHAVHFNLSHAHGRMLMAVTRGDEVGVDLELIRDKVDVVKLAERFYVRAEYEHVLSQSEPMRIEQFYRYWVAKEALLKGQGVGISSLHECEILSRADAVSSHVRLSDGTSLEAGWTIRWLNCGEGWSGAVSLHGDQWAVHVF